MSDTKKTLSTSDIAKALKLDAKQFRKLLRSQATKANGGARYEFKESDLPKLRKMGADLIEAKQTAA